MFVYARNLQLALKDKLRRAGMAAVAGVALMLAAGFLLAALWTFLAVQMGWGSMYASLAIGGGLVLIALVLLLMAKSERHRTPTTQELQAEVTERVSALADTAMTRATTAAETAMDRASTKANELLDRAGHSAHSFADDLTYRADRLADRAEARVQTAARDIGESAVKSLGISPHLMDIASQKLGMARRSNAASLAPVLGAFAVGITLASRFQDWRHRDDVEDDDWEDDDWEDPRHY